MSEIQTLWVDKYRPIKLDDYVLNSDIKTYFKDMILHKSLQNMGFVGCQGSGKTTLMKLLCNELNADVLFIKCSTEGTIDILRSKVEPFCNAMSFDGKLKIVCLDEIDSSSSSGQNNFQLGLRTLIESAQDDTRFILTCNFVNKVIPAILSRCPIIPLKFEKKDLLVHLKNILDLEQIKYTKESLKSFIEESFVFYPDCRRIINYLQFCCNSGELIVKLNSAVNASKNEFLTTLIDTLKIKSKPLAIRQFYLQNKSNIDDYKIFAGELYDAVIDKQLIDDPRVILKMSDIIYQMNLVVNPEIQFFALICLIQMALQS